ncbi:MAG: hypothetical protein FJX67_14340 [Alphaproteobacteria bacterium]|nr:hypothetical protein [Alphaproteobacteria bacterium]
MIPVYVGGKGMNATERTHTVKCAIFTALRAGGAAVDTRHRYYRAQYPDMAETAFDRMVCAPIERYDRDWPAFRDQAGDADPDQVTTRFFAALDRRFRDEAVGAIYAYDEAGFGSGVNSLRFLVAGKPVLGLLGATPNTGPANRHNVLQLALEFPALMTLAPYRELADIDRPVRAWLARFAAPST